MSEQVRDRPRGLADATNRRPSRWESWASVGLAATVIAIMASPAVVGNSVFGIDYENHFWLVGYQAQAIAHSGHPSLFVHDARIGIFEPFYGFYGGTLYAIGGYLSVAIGSHPLAAYALLIVFGMAMAYGGTWWLGRLLGLSTWIAHAPAIVVLTSPYFLTDVYARGAWTEFMAISSIPLVVAGVIAHLRAERWRAGPFAALMVSAVFMTGSHNITLLWGTVVFGLLACALLFLFRAEVGSWRRVVSVVGVLLLAVGINAWFLAIDVRFASRTQAGHHGTFPFFGAFDTFHYLFTPFRTMPPEWKFSTQGLAVAAPVFALAWALVVGVASWRRGDAVGRKLFALMLISLVALFTLIMCPPFWHWLRGPLKEIQFPYRLNGFVLLMCAGLVIAAIRMCRRPRFLVVLVVILGVSIGQGAWQIWHIGNTSKSAMRLDETFAAGYQTKPPTWYDGGFYSDASQPVVSPAPTRIALIAPPEPGTSHLTPPVTIPAGSGPVELNVEGGPYLVSVTGAPVLGRTKDGRVVIAAPDSPTPRVIQMSISLAHNRTLTLAPIVTEMSLVTFALWWLLLLLRARFRRGDSTAESG